MTNSIAVPPPLAEMYVELGFKLVHDAPGVAHVVPSLNSSVCVNRVPENKKAAPKSGPIRERHAHLYRD